MKDSDRSCGADHIRITRTDWCYQQCYYCMPHDEVRFFSRGKMLHFEAIPFTAEKRGRLKQETNLYPLNCRRPDDPAKRYRRLDTHREKIGPIGAINLRLCHNYNRLQVKPEINLRLFKQWEGAK